MKIAISSDHAGFEYKEKIRALLIGLGHEVKDFGTFSNAPVDYPLFIRPAAEGSPAVNVIEASFLVGRGTERPLSQIRSTESVARCAGTWRRLASRANITTATFCPSAS